MTDSHTEEPSVVSSSFDVGKRLREAREAKKIPVNDAAAQLRVTREAIIHLEEQNWDKLHGRTYARGYFLSYVKFLGLPQDEMLAGFNIEFNETANRTPSVAPIQQLKPARSSFPWLPTILLGLVAILAWFAYQQWQLTQFEQGQDVPQQPLIEPLDSTEDVVPREPVPVIDNSDQLVTESDIIPEETRPGNQADEPVIQETMDAESSLALSDEQTEQNEAVNSPEISEKNLTIGLNADCWVEVRDADQQVLISRIVRGGNTVELNGTAPFQVSLGQASAASVRYEGDIVDISQYIRGDVARFTVGADS